jgi:hypothetical protein
MNYYKQGDAAKADKIKAAFEKLGYNTGNLGFTSSQLYFTIEGKVELIGTKALQNLIKTHPDYKELELPVEQMFKVGDWLYHNTLGIRPILVKGYSETQGYKVECIKTTYYLQKGVVENEYHLWTIADANDGDVLATDNGWTCIFKAFDGRVFSSYCFMDSQKWFCEFGSEAHTLDNRINGNIHPATKEQRDLLFKKMEEAGYTWDADKKELCKIQPHYDIANFKAGMPVLVRDNIRNKWLYSLFGMYNKDNVAYPFVVVDMRGYAQCIPFNEDTKHLLGTTNMPSEEYINW